MGTAASDAGTGEISPHRLENAASPRIRAVHTVTEDVIDVFDFGLQNLFKEERQPTKSLIADDKAPMGLDILFDEDRQDSESFGLDVLFGEAPYPDIDDDWVMEFGLSELFNDGAEDAAAKRPWTATEVAWMAATGAAVAVPLFFWTIRDCTRAGYRNIKRIVMR
eukprot:evm.model.scf_537.3 EVM.evm.TU.scf_537.3   scf_537:50007-53393(-)